MAKKKKAKKKTGRHPRIRKTCKLCGRSHSGSSHRFHGRGSFARTHKKKKTRKRGRR